jgi:nicotinamide-nucleotide amidase
MGAAESAENAMQIWVICVGDEILRGHTLNTNLAFIGDTLAREGYSITRECTIPDEENIIAATLTESLNSADLVITTGGLGPTTDDITRTVAAGVLERPLQFDPDILAGINAFLRSRNVSVPADALRRQAMVPTGTDTLTNANGTAPGLWCQLDKRALLMLPGPPRELEPMFRTHALPRIRQAWPAHLATRTCEVCGLAESVVAERVEPVLEAFPEVRPAYCARPGQLTLTLTAHTSQREELERAFAEVHPPLGTHVLPADCKTVGAAVGKLLMARSWNLATAESCTGGAIAKAITDVPGASAFFCGSFVTYANAWKEACLGVRPKTLAAHGAVSRETAEEMLDGLLARDGVDAGIVVTGIAGPTGGTPDKPVGLVFVGTGFRTVRRVERCVFPGNRESVRLRTVAVALNQLRQSLLAVGDEA